MRNIWTIARREYKAYFSSPIAYVVVFMILIAVGGLFVLNIVYSVAQSQTLWFPSPPPDAGIITGPLAFLLVLSTTALTIRLLAEEQRSGTLELMLTAPVRDWELIVGKWLGALLFVMTILGVTLVIYPTTLNLMVEPGIDKGIVFTGYLGVLLATAAFLAIGVAASAMFNNQVAVFFTNFGLFIVLWWLIGIPASVFPVGGQVFYYLDFSAHFLDTMRNGIIALSDIVYYLSLTALGLFMGSVAIEIRRWQ